jgi:hypothetical protein
MYWQRPGIRRRLTAGHRLLAAETLAGRQVGIRIEATLLLFCDLNTRDCCAAAEHALLGCLLDVDPALQPGG